MKQKTRMICFEFKINKNERKIRIIRKIQKSILMKSSSRTIERFKKQIRKIVKSSSRFSRFQNEIYSNENDDDDEQLNIKFIETISFHILTKSNDQKFDVKICQITLQQLNVVIFQILQIY